MTSTTTGCAPRIGGVRNSAGFEMWIYEEVADGYGVNCGQLIRDLAAAGPVPVSVRVNSPGGDAFAGLALFESLRQHEGRVTVYVDGLAGSIASVIAMAGDEVVVAPGGMIFVHDALTVTVGNEADHLATAALLSTVSDSIAAIYAARAGGTSAEWRKVMRGERWYSASEAVDAGLADRVADVPVPANATARDHARIAARTHTQRPSLSAFLVSALAPAPSKGRRRPVPSAMATVRQLKAAREPARPVRSPLADLFRTTR